MISTITLKRLMNCFPGSFINSELEFIAIPKTNLYFNLEKCESDFDVRCKVLEWFSRDSYKTEPYKNKTANAKYHDYVRCCVNDFLQTNFSEEDMRIIYTKLGNCVDHEFTKYFINNNYNLKLLQEE